MTKAKLILSGIALFAVIGGALAFNATKVSYLFFTTTTTIINGVTVTQCTFPTTALFTTNPANAVGPLTTVSNLSTAATTASTCTAIVYPAL